MDAASVELRHEDVPPTRARERASPEIHDAEELSRQQHVARAVHRNAPSGLIRRVAEALAPQVGAVGVELRHEDVQAARARERAASKVYDTGKTAGDHHI